METCAVCGQKIDGFARILAPGVKVCMDCNPFMRCGANLLSRICLGEMEPAGTATDQSRYKCDLCGRTERK